MGRKRRPLGFLVSRRDPPVRIIGAQRFRCGRRRGAPLSGAFPHFVFIHDNGRSLWEKHMLPGIVLVVVVGVLRPNRVLQDADDAKTVIEKAVKAQGGEDKLAAVQGRGAGRAKARLTPQGPETSPLTLETVLPAARQVQDGDALRGTGKKRSRSSRCSRGEKGLDERRGEDPWIWRGNCSKPSRKSSTPPMSRDAGTVAQGGKGYTLSKLEGDQGPWEAGSRCSRWRAKDHKDIELYFDRGQAFCP